MKPGNNEKKNDCEKRKSIKYTQTYSTAYCFEIVLPSKQWAIDEVLSRFVISDGCKYTKFLDAYREASY